MNSISELVEEAQRRGLDPIQILKDTIEEYDLLYQDMYAIYSCIREKIYSCSLDDGNLIIRISDIDSQAKDEIIRVVSKITYCSYDELTDSMEILVYGYNGNTYRMFNNITH